MVGFWHIRPANEYRAAKAAWKECRRRHLTARNFKSQINLNYGGHIAILRTFDHRVPHKTRDFCGFLLEYLPEIPDFPGIS